MGADRNCDVGNHPFVSSADKDPVPVHSIPDHEQTGTEGLTSYRQHEDVETTTDADTEVTDNSRVSSASGAVTLELLHEKLYQWKQSQFNCRAQNETNANTVFGVPVSILDSQSSEESREMHTETSDSESKPINIFVSTTESESRGDTPRPSSALTLKHVVHKSGDDCRQVVPPNNISSVPIAALPRVPAEVTIETNTSLSSECRHQSGGFDVKDECTIEASQDFPVGISGQSQGFPVGISGQSQGFPVGICGQSQGFTVGISRQSQGFHTVTGGQTQQFEVKNSISERTSFKKQRASDPNCAGQQVIRKQVFGIPMLYNV